MKKVIYTADAQEIPMPQTNDVKIWEDFFKNLMATDPVAPGLATYYHYCIIGNYEPVFHDRECVKYYDIAIEISADDRYPANVAAVSAGFIQEGVRQMTAEVAAEGPWAEMFKPVLCSHLKKTAPDDDLGLYSKSKEKVISHWVGCMEREMMEDVNAHSIITGYYLSAKVGYDCSIFAPLGYVPYQEIGEKMAKDPVVMGAAKKSGLLVSGIQTFMEAALSNEGCWDCMVDGVAYLLNNPDLRHYIPFRNRYVAERLLLQNDVIESGKQTWDEVYKRLASELSDEWAHGY